MARQPGGRPGPRGGGSAIPRRWTVVLQFAGEFTTAGGVLARRKAADRGMAEWELRGARQPLTTAARLRHLARPDANVRRMPLGWIGLGLAFVAAVVTNMAYSLEHHPAPALPPLSPRRPLRTLDFLIHDRRWMKAFVAETTGW